ncbi:MAG TPA: DUF6504 family protein [Streptosporangiaceae bacterium]
MYGLTFNDRISDVVTDGHGLPLAWTWRGSRYAAGEVVERWVTTWAWWRDLEVLAPDAPMSIEHFVLHAVGGGRAGQVQLARDDATMAWRLIGIVGTAAPGPR